MPNRLMSVFVAAGVAIMVPLALPGSANAAEFKTTYDEILAAAKQEDPVQWCTGMSPKESQPIVDAFMALFPDVPEPNDFECFSTDATQRVVAEWSAGATQVDVLDTDTEILEQLEEENLTYVADWSVFDGSIAS